MDEQILKLDAQVLKVDEALGLVFGWGVISTEDGQPYVDLQGDNIDDGEMLRMTLGFAKSARAAKAMHQGGVVGSVPLVFPLTAEIAKAFGIECKRTGMLCGMAPEATVLAKFKSGEYTGFSIGGRGKRVPVELP